jgi:hypothetical protein
MTITLPDEWRGRLEALAKSRGFVTVDECLLDLLQDLACEAEAFPKSSEVIDSQLTPRNRAELEAMLDEGMKSGCIVEADEAFWAERRRVLLEKFSRKTGTTP